MIALGLTGGLARVRAGASLASGLARGAWSLASGRAHPQPGGRLRVNGAEHTVEVVRDRHGVPHVFAQAERDALFGQGFIHAQDRLFQMEGARRLASGRLAEVAGRGAVASDRFMRRLGLAHIAGGDLETTSADDLALVEAYARGVNAGVASLPALPPEFDVLDFEPEAWRPEDSMLVGRLIMFGFAGNWDTELLRERLLHLLGPRRAAALDAGYPGERLTHNGHPSPGASRRILAAYEAALEAGLMGGGASNAWAVSGARTATGAPLLASDPHLESRMPGLFHVSHIRGGQVDAAGADIAGIPGVAIGHNGAMAWGLTAGMADVADCYVETIDPDDPARYFTPEGWVRGEVRRERIRIKGGAEVEETVLITRHGPVIGPALAGEDREVALRSTALEPGGIVAPFLALWRARDPEAFEAALAGWSGATFNWVYAHTGGRIGYRMAGGIPARSPSVGLLPQDGARSPGAPPLHPDAALPRYTDPPDGLVVSANHAPGGELPLGEEWCEPWRAERIVELIEARERHDVRSFESIQSDVRSAPLLRLRDMVLEADPAPSPARTLLESWDGEVTAESAGAALMETVYEELAREFALRMAGPAAPVVLGNGVDGVAPHSSFHYRLQGLVLQHLDGCREPWPSREARDRVLAAASARAERTLRARLGGDPARWSWGALHPLALNHPLGRVPGLRRWLSRGPYPLGGDVNTVRQGGYNVYRGPEFTGFSPVYRQVIDVSDFDRSTFMLPTGTSGIPGHPRYDDCIEEHLRGETRPLLYTRAAVEAAAEHVLVLEPA